MGYLHAIIIDYFLLDCSYSIKYIWTMSHVCHTAVFQDVYTTTVELPYWNFWLSAKQNM